MVVNPIDIRSLSKKDQERVKKANAILERIRRQTATGHPELFEAFYEFEFVPVEEKTILDTDGKNLYYNPSRVLAYYESMSLAEYTHALWHVTLHCLLGHLRDCVGKKGKKKKHAKYDEQVGDCLMKLYLSFDFYRGMDNHEVWYQIFESEKESRSQEQDEDGNAEINIPSDTFEKICARWTQITENIHQDAEKYQKNFILGKIWGNNAGTMVQESEPAEGEPLDYKEELRKVFKPCESPAEKDDCFDMMLYQYGYALNPDSPLIEPAEESWVNGITNIAVALDVSGSCTDYQGEFLRELNGLFECADTIKTITCFHCDDEITYEKSFKNQNRMGEEVMEELKKARGFGGTDFRPVFTRLEEIMEQENRKYDILIYYSDLYGDFPSKKPKYPVYFVMPKDCTFEEGFRNWVPNWVNILQMK